MIQLEFGFFTVTEPEKRLQREQKRLTRVKRKSRTVRRPAAKPKRIKKIRAKPSRKISKKPSSSRVTCELCHRRYRTLKHKQCPRCLRKCLKCDRPIMSRYPGICKNCKRHVDWEKEEDDDYTVYL